VSSSVISVEFLADITDVIDNVEAIIESVTSVGDTAGIVGELSASFSEAAQMAGELASQVESVAGASGALSEVGASASELDSSLASVGSAASEAASGIAEISSASGSVADVSASVADLDTELSTVAGAAADAASSVEASMSSAGAAAEEAATATGEAGAQGGMDFMGGMSKAGMALMGVQMATQMVGGAFQQATGPFGNFQEQMTSLVTGAGESTKNLQMVSDGIKQMSVQTGESTDELSAGMYMIESAGFHGAAGLKVLQAAAEGAKVGAASLADVANGVTTAMTDYASSGLTASQATNQLIATVAAGKMHMGDLANSLAAVLPLASSAGISFAQVGGAIATMTAQGMSAQNATQNLANTISALQNPNAQAVTEMTAMGLSANDVSTQLGKKGLTGTLEEVSQAVMAHMGPAGLVLQSTFKNSANAMKDAQQEISAMPSSLQKVAEAYLHGSLTTKQWSADMAGLDPLTKHMMTQFAATAKQTDSFNSLLTKGGPAAQTYNAAMSKILGGTTGLNTALKLTGDNMGTFKTNVENIATAGKHGGDSITGWNLVQGDFNQKMAQAAAGANIMWINIGQNLAPAILGLLSASQGAGAAIGRFASFLSGSSVGAIALKIVFIALGGAILGFVASAIPALVAGFIAWAAGAWAAASATIIAAAPFILIGAAIALLIVGIILLVQHWGQVVAFMRGVWMAFSSWFMGALHAVGAFFASIWGSIVAFMTGVWAKIVSGAQTAWNMLVNVVKIALIVLLAIVFAPIVAIAALFIWLYQHNTYFQKLVDAIRGYIQAGVDWLRGIWSDIIGWIVAKWTYLKDMATMYFMAMVVEIQARIQQARGFIMSVWNNVVSFLTGIWNTIVSNVSTMWSKISAFFASAWSTYVSTPLTNLWNSITNFISGWPTKAVQWGINLIQGFINGIVSMVGNVGGAVGQIMGKVGNFLGFHSPSKEGPGMELDVWPRNMVAEYAAGITAGTPLIEAAVTHLMAPTSAMGVAPTSAATGGASHGQASGNGHGEIHVHNQIILNGQELTNQLMMHAVSEIRRTGPVSSGRAA
jgi:phage-related protein